MANELTHYYLQQMGIQAWVVRDELSGDDILARLSREAAVCKHCRLHQYRQQAVFSKGNSSAGLMIISHAPVHFDQQKPEILSGKSSLLLNKMLASIGLNEQSVYITSLLKCGVPDNQSATSAECDACHPFLLRQIELVSPKVLLILGEAASQYLLNTSLPLDALRQCSQSYQDIPCVISYHPDELLAHPAFKKNAWQDLCALQAMV